MSPGSREGEATLSSLVNGGARAELGGPRPIASGLQVESSFSQPPHCNLNPKLPTPLASWAPPLTPFTGEIVSGASLQPQEELVCPTSLEGMQQGLMAQGIHSCGKAGSWAFSFTPSSPNGSGGGTPHQGQSGSSAVLTAR